MDSNDGNIRNSLRFRRERYQSSNGLPKKIEEEVSELRESIAEGDKKKIEDEIGDVIFSAVNLARFMGGKSAEEILAATTEKFKKRFKHREKSLREKGSSLEASTLGEMDKLWNEAKNRD